MDFVKLAVLSACLTLVDCSVIIDILKYKNINNCIFFHCHKEKHVVAMAKLYNENNIGFSNVKMYNVSRPIPLYKKVALIVNTSCESWRNAIEYIDKNIAFKSPFVWLILTRNLSQVTDILSRYPIEVDSDVTIIHQDVRYYLYEIYNTGFYTYGTFKSIFVGHWNSKFQLQKFKRFDLTGVKLKCVIVVTQRITHQTFETYIEQLQQTAFDNLHRLKFFTLLKYTRDMYNLSYILQRTNSWGYLHNNSFDGLIGALQRKGTDIGGSPVFIKKERAEVVDYCAQTWHSRQTFILRHPKHPGGFYTIYTHPLTARVWYCIIALLVLSGTILTGMLQINILMDSNCDSSPSLALLVIWSALCQQGASLNRNSTSIKLVVFSTFVFSVTLYQYYNATVVSTLLREAPKNIRTLKDLLESNMKIGIEDVLSNKDYFKHTTDPVALELYSKKVSTTTDYNFFSPEHGMAMVKRGGFAFHVDSAVGYGIMKRTFNERELCDAHEIDLFPPQSMGAVVRKGSPYKEHIAYGVRRMFESGLMKRLVTIWDEPKPPCVRTPDTSVFSVTIREFSTALFVLLFGIIASIIILLGELAIHRIKALQ